LQIKSFEQEAVLHISLGSSHKAKAKYCSLLAVPIFIQAVFWQPVFVSK
jgi:hypothetical protein